MALHTGYETVEPYILERVDLPDTGHSPKALLKADPENNCIVLDTQTTLLSVPPEAWQYRLGNRSALEWILEQYQERKPRDPTLRAQFATYRFADYKDKGNRLTDADHDRQRADAGNRQRHARCCILNRVTVRLTQGINSTRLIKPNH